MTPAAKPMARRIRCCIRGSLQRGVYVIASPFKTMYLYIVLDLLGKYNIQTVLFGTISINMFVQKENNHG
jgi:hypothetical protein